ncbi:MAG TPA: hypothetical protein VII86_12260, partial [Thermoanaerobaculia bacterium]
LPDLLVYLGDRLFLYPGEPKGSRPLTARALWSFPVSGAPKREQRDDDGTEGPGPERERHLEVLDLPGGGRIAIAQGAQKDGRTVLTLVARK